MADPYPIINEQIRCLGIGHFDQFLADEFIAKFNDISAGRSVVDTFLQISNDDEKKTGYNTVKPDSAESLRNDKMSLQNY